MICGVDSLIKRILNELVKEELVKEFLKAF